ncbi:MAG: ATP-binding protein [Caldimonas sp.]
MNNPTVSASPAPPVPSSEGAFAAPSVSTFEALADIVAHAPALIWSAGPHGGNDWLSPAWSNFTGLSVAGLLGEGWKTAVHPEDVERCAGIRATSFEAGRAYSLDFRLRRHDGQFRWMADSASPRRDPAGQVIGYVGSCVDVHERHELEETLAARTRELRLAERRQDTFLAKLSHELRNPLAPIANTASVLRTLEHSNPILVRLREILERQVERLTRLVEELIDVTRAAHGQISIVRQAVSVESIVQTAVANSHETVTTGGHRLSVDLPSERLYVRGDIVRLAQALGGLIGNAAKFTRRAGVITIAVRRVAKTVQFVVRDEGEGIDPEFLPHAFDLFSQQDQSRGRMLGGLGVGLTLARRIAQLHGGDVEGFSEGQGKGSEFVLWLPLEAEKEDGDGLEAAPPLDSFRVLIIEDNADARESLRLQMEMWGNEVTTAASAAEALDKATAARPQIVLCDIGLPGVDGYRLVGSLRRTLEGSPVTYVAVTGYAGGEDQRRALEAGFDAFLVKPLRPESLARLLRSCAGQAA